MFLPPRIKKAKPPTEKEIEKILRSAPKRDLALEEIRALLHSDKKYWKKIIRAANKTKEQFFGKGIHFYAPLYFDSYCINDCLYCDFRKSNKECFRKRLSFEEFKKELDYLFKKGYTKIELVSSTDPSFPIERLSRFVKYSRTFVKRLLSKPLDAETKRLARFTPSLALDRVGMNNSPLTVAEYKILRKAGLGWSWLWMESYEKKYYKKYHPERIEKSDFHARLESYDRMGKAGLNIGIAFLMGLSPTWQQEIFSTIAHAKYLQQKYGCEIEFGTPRFCPPRHAPLKKAPFPEAMTDDKFRLMVALYRLAIRNCWINASTRENMEMLEKLWLGGANLTNPEVRSIPGGYSLKTKGAQFQHYSFEPGIFAARIKRLGLKAVF
jgi:2-iminoacetate synthase